MKYPTWLKNWMWNLEIMREVRDDTVRAASMDAFAKAHADLKETMVDETETKAEELAKAKLQALLSPISWDSVVTVDQERGLVLMGGERIEDGKLKNLQSEAEFFMASDLWRVMNETPKALAEKAMFIEGDTVDFLKKGRSMLYTLSSQQKIIDTFRALSKK